MLTAFTGLAVISDVSGRDRIARGKSFLHRLIQLILIGFRRIAINIVFVVFVVFVGLFGLLVHD